MWLIDQLAERRILEAQQRGEFDHLAGAGRPLVLGDDRLVPEALRAGYRVLRNAGYLPPELSLRHEIASVDALLAQVRDPAMRNRVGRRLSCLRASLQAQGGDLRVEAGYLQPLSRRLDGMAPSGTAAQVGHADDRQAQRGEEAEFTRSQEHSEPLCNTAAAAPVQRFPSAR